MMHKLVLTLLLILLIPANHAVANEENQFITIVNPVRISYYTPDPVLSLSAQYKQIEDRNLMATWLLTSDVLDNESMLQIIKKMNPHQEAGLFVEVTLKFASDAGVEYHQTDSWHRSNSLFLSGYTQTERLKLIDYLFEKFHKKFGYFPTSVGAWWIDSFSLNYMKEKYFITANLTVADQFSTDGYQVWGQYWSTPFYPNKINAAVPANKIDNKLDVVTIQWASRDPLNGYFGDKASLYSTQDYLTIGLKDEYFEKLIELYGRKNLNLFGQITIGLESDLPIKSYLDGFSRQMDTANKFVKNGVMKSVTMRDFAKWYMEEFKGLSPEHIVMTDDFLNKKMTSVWYQSPNYRIGIVYDKETGNLEIVDLRAYSENFEEPYNVMPNRQHALYINVPSIIDKVNNEAESWTIRAGRLDSINGDYHGLDVNFENLSIILSGNFIRLESNNDLDVPNNIAKSPFLNFVVSKNKLTLSPISNWEVDQSGLRWTDLSPEFSALMLTKKVIVSLVTLSLLLTFVLYILFRRLKHRKWQFAGLFMVGLFICLGFYLVIRVNAKNYFVSQSEVDALIRLRSLPYGRVAVNDNVCLQCLWHSEYMPAVFANKRNYVQKITKKPITYSTRLSEKYSRQEIIDEIKKNRIKYFYLTNYEDYSEKMPFSPGDFGVEKLYANANAEIWGVK